MVTMVPECELEFGLSIIYKILLTDFLAAVHAKPHKASFCSHEGSQHIISWLVQYVSRIGDLSKIRTT